MSRTIGRRDFFKTSAGAGLTLHPGKTRLVDMTGLEGHFDFLGYRTSRFPCLTRPSSTTQKNQESVPCQL